MSPISPYLAVVAAAALVFSFTPTVFSQEPAAQPALQPTVLVLDSSGSMTEIDVDDRSRMDAAKQAVTDFIDQVPANSPLGLITYGTGTGSSDEEKEAGCQDVSVIARPGEKDNQALKDEVTRLTPRGYTPIGNALRQAAELLPKEGPRSIVLVSDGIDTCAPPPVCEIAQQIKRQGTDIVVHTIGFKVDDAARTELECIAQATGGTYSDASSSESLSASLATATTRRAVGYQLPAQRVEFSGDKAKAPLLDVGTLDNPARYHAEITTSENENAYARITVPEGHWLHVGFNSVPPVGTKTFLEEHYGINFSAENCTGESVSASDLTADAPAAGFYFAKDCSGEINLYARPTGTVMKDIDLTIAAVPTPTEFGDAFNKTASTARTVADLGQPAPSENPQTITPASQPDKSAPLLNGTIEAEIVEGETQYLAVPIEWGQALDITAEILENTSTENDNSFTEVARTLDISFTNALHQKVDQENTGPLYTKDISKPQVFGTAYPVSYANTEGLASGKSSWLGGTHYVQISARSHHRETNTDATTELKPIKYRLTATPIGAAVTGPTFPKTPTGKSPSSTTAQPTESIDSTSGNSKTNWLLPIGIGALILALIGIGLAVIIRRR